MSNALDLHAIVFLSRFPRSSVPLNRFLFYLSGSNMVTWVPATALLWWAWFRDSGGKMRNRQLVISCLLSSILLAVIFYLIQETAFSFRFRPRPMVDSSNGFQLPAGIDQPGSDSFWRTSSSFPSGHAAALASFSVGLFLISRRVGITALIYSSAVCFLRVFFGMHYVTDILAGILIGLLTIYVAVSEHMERLLGRPIIRFAVNRAPLFYSAFFVLTYEVASGFSEAKSFIHLLKSL